MPEATYQFPAGFMWGTATASHQVEGNNTNNNWAAWEAQEGRIKFEHKSGLACDWWGGRWKEDFDRAASTYQNAHRLSLEWSRIQPAPDLWDDEALDHYRQMIKGLIERGITPFVTLHHFSDPLWFSEMGGWENDAAIEYFSAYVRRVVEVLKDQVSLWCTINEPNVYTYSGYVEGTFPPGKKDIQAAFDVMSNMVRGHAAAYRIIHGIQPQAMAGFALHYRGFRPDRSWFPPDAWVASAQSNAFNAAFPNALVDGKFRFLTKHCMVPQAARSQDYLGLNYYTTDQVQFSLDPKTFFSKRFFPKGADVSETGFLANVPEGIFRMLHWASGFGLPIIISENGVEDSSDSLRPRYLAEHLHQIWHATNYNWKIKGYFHWSLVDNFEWERGWTQRFGLWGLDPQTQERVRRPSAGFYATICKENALSYEAVERYAPQSIPVLFP